QEFLGRQVSDWRRGKIAVNDLRFWFGIDQSPDDGCGKLTAYRLFVRNAGIDMQKCHFISPWYTFVTGASIVTILFLSTQYGTLMEPGIMDVTKPPHDLQNSDCQKISQVLARVGEKWSVLIIMLLADGPRRF